MRALLVALALLLASPAAAFATTYHVNDPTDPPASPDTTPGDDHCDYDAATAGDQCTLRAAIQEANAHGGADMIVFDSGAKSVQANAGFSGSDITAPNCCAVLGPTTIDGGGTTTITFAAAATGPLLAVSANDSVLRGLTITGGTGDAVRLFSQRDRLDSVTVHDVTGNAVVVSGADARLDGVHASKPGKSGVVVFAPRTTISGADISGAHDHGVEASSDGAHISGGKIHGNGGDGVHVNGQANVVSQVPIFGNAGRPIALGPGANGGIQPPQNLRIGPRRADGSLPLTGTNPAGGSYEIFRGDPFSSSQPGYLATFSSGPGDFTYNFPTEPNPGDTFSLTVTNPGTSEFANVTTPADIVSPDVTRARALSPTEVRVETSEPIDPATVAPGDFALSMAGKDRQVSGVAAGSEGTRSWVTLTSSGWKAGEAGYVNLTSAGAVTDMSGNASLATTRRRVAAAPGDFLAPIAGQLSLKPKNICLTHGHGCRRTGTVIRFVTSEPGKATIVIQRGNKRVGTRTYGAVEEGKNALKFNGRLGGRKLRAGRYRLLVFVQDPVGNVTNEPPITLMTVRRTTK